MSKYYLKFWFEHGGICIWGMNDNAQEKYGYAIKNDALPISRDLINELDSLEEEYSTYLDMDYPPDPSPWTEEHKLDFINRATISYKKLIEELGSDFEVENKINSCVM